MQQTATPGTEVERLRQRLAAREQELGSHRTRLRRQLELAATVHRSLLPKPVRDERIHVDIRYVPIEQVGGDYCQVRFSGPDVLYVAICDVTGHGIGAALLATRVSSEVRHGILYGRPPREIVRSLNDFICDHFEEAGLYLTFVVAQIDLYRRCLTWSGAGHPSPLLIRRNGETLEPLVSQNPMIGVTKDILADRPEDATELETGDRLLFYTDGLTETLDTEGRQFGASGLADAAKAAMPLDLFEVADHVLSRVAQYDQSPTPDDMTLIVVEIH